jgi:hypothetical protein
MQDLVFIAVIVAFFALLWLLIGAFDRIIGSDEDAFAGQGDEPGPVEPSQPEQMAA